MGQVLRTTLAHLDLIEIAVYLGKLNPAAANRVLNAISDRCNTLSDFPELGRKRDELAPLLRSFPVGNYVIYYRPRQGGIEVVRVLHGARDLAHFFKD